MLRIRLSRVGKKKHPAYRIVVIDRRKPRDGANVEVIGHFDPLTEPETVKIKEDRAIYWLKNGAMPSDTAARLLTKAGIMEQAGRKPFVYVGKQVPKGQKNPKKGRKDGAEEGAAPAAPAAAATAPAAEAKAEAPAEKPKAEAKTEA
ncbi:MAG: 30S ribosomal protein S16, partial [Chloroflexi bacterium]|nr:30S ribosomal protein S16 [Chloroflexota bacterium]